jgi:hypothetical protein
MKKIQIAFALLCAYQFANAQAPKYSNEFLSIGVGARALAMSNSFTAISDDVTSGFWNPAGLCGIKSNLQLGLMHSEYFAGIAKYDYIGIGARFDDKSAGSFSFIRFGVDDIPNTTELIDNNGNIDYDRVTTFSAADYGFLFSYGRVLKEGLSIGGSVKIIHRKVGDFARSWGFGLDAGIKYKLNDWTFAAFGKDITSTFNAWSYTLTDRMKEVFTITNNEIPANSLEVTLPKLILSTARTLKLSETFNILADIDLDITFDGMRNVLIKSDPISIDPHIGTELGYKDFLFVRAGIGNIQKESDMTGKQTTSFQPNIGVGIKIKDTFTLDYALTDIGDQSIALYSNIFSLKININHKATTN